MQKLKQIIREPLVHFLLLGAGIYALYGAVSDDTPPENEQLVTVSANDIKALTDQWSRAWMRPPTEEELAGLIRDSVRTQILYREAVAMGLDNGDLVIERRLAQKVELLAQSLVTPAEPSEETLRAWYEEKVDDFRPPDLYTLTHIFFDPDKRQQTTLDDARVVLDEIKGLDGLPTDIDVYGDRFMLQNRYPARTELELRKLFGSGFTEQLVSLEPGRWYGPLLSGYGTHLVYIEELVRASPPPFEEIEEQLKGRWMAEQIDQLSKQFIDSLVARYEIVVEETPVEITVPGMAEK